MFEKITRKSDQTRAERLKGSVYVKCAFCGRDNKKEQYRSEGFRIVKCPCGLTYPNPRLSMSEIDSLYNDQDISGIWDYLKIEEDNKTDFERRVKLIEDFTNKKGKMLDVGCNIGSLIEIMQKHGWDCLGIDVNESAINIAKKRGLNCLVYDFFRVKAKFDLITMNDLIEHLENPNKAFKKAYSLLNKKGIIYLSTPKGNSFMCRFTKGRWLHRKPRQHLYIFTSDTITKMLEKNEFEVLYLSTVGRTRSIKLLIEKMGSYSMFIKAALDRITPKVIGDLSISINPLDEMHIIARKK